MSSLDRIGAREAEAIAASRGRWLKQCSAKAHARFASCCAENSCESFARDADAIAARRGGCPNSKTANDHAVLASSYVPKSGPSSAMLRMEAAERAASRGLGLKVSTANAQAVFASDCMPKAVIRGREAAASESRQGMSRLVICEQAHAGFASPRGLN